MKYTAEEVRDYANACRLAHKGPVIADMLTAYAERIKADENAVSDESVERACREYFGEHWPDDIEDLVWNFALALGNKLADAAKKYGYTDGWRSPDWMDECRTKLMDHIRKGDPRDVAAYCAFLWYHGESTASIADPASQAIREVYVCSNPKCTAVYAADPMGHCPKCKQANGSGWSTARSDVL